MLSMFLEILAISVIFFALAIPWALFVMRLAEKHTREGARFAAGLRSEALAAAQRRAGIVLRVWPRKRMEAAQRAACERWGLEKKKL